MVAFAFLTIGSAISTPACESRHVDLNYGTEAGADFEAGTRDVRSDGAGETDAGADADQTDAGAD
jgi:hypothetical protein